MAQTPGMTRTFSLNSIIPPPEPSRKHRNYATCFLRRGAPVILNLLPDGRLDLTNPMAAAYYWAARDLGIPNLTVYN